MAAKRTTGTGKTTRKRRGIKVKPTELGPSELGLRELKGDVGALATLVVEDGGAVLGAYREPLGGHPLLLVALPIELCGPTPYQRDVSEAHVRKLTRAMDKTRRFLDPIIAVRTGEGYQTPNGNHRLTVLKELGARSIIALLVPDPAVAFQILALNIEKAHNLRERAWEVRRMVDVLAATTTGNESSFELELEEPWLVTLGFAYALRPRISGGAYSSVLRAVDGWLEEPLSEAVLERERRASVLLRLDDAVTGAVNRLKERGLTSPYLRAFVVARINPLRFAKGEPPSFDALLAKMEQRAIVLDAEKIRTEDLARSGGAPEE
jgi:ParB family transcriptional regulator, chromosome partitioning protein